VDGTDLTIGAETLRYYPGGAVPGRTDVPDFNEDDDLLARDHPRLRRILVRTGLSGPLTPMVLHWSDGSDLRSLDGLLAAGDSGAGYLTNAVAGGFAFHLCSDCESGFRVVDLSAPITYALGISVEDVRRHAFHSACPNCGAPTRRSLLEFMKRL
jgi:hypothetical protein